MTDRVFKLMGSHSTTKRSENDFYISSPEIVRALSECVRFGMSESAVYGGETVIADSSVGTGSLLEPFGDCRCVGYDITDRGYSNVRIQDWLTVSASDIMCVTQSCPKIIVQNPPFKNALDFVLHSIELLNPGELLFSLHRLLFLEGKERLDKLYREAKPKYVFVFSTRVSCIVPDVPEKGKNAVCYAWFMWEKGFSGDTQIKWITEEGKILE